MLFMYYAAKNFQQTHHCLPRGVQIIALRRSAKPSSYKQGAQILPIFTHKSLE